MNENIIFQHECKICTDIGYPKSLWLGVLHHCREQSRQEKNERLVVARDERERERERERESEMART